MEFDTEFVIRQPVEKVFGHFADIEGRPNWVTPAVEREKLTEGPVGVGTKYRSVDRLPGRRIEFSQEVTAYVPNELVSEAWTGPLAGRSETRFAPQDGATRLTLHMEVAPSGMFKVLAPIIRGWVQRALQKDLARFEAWVAASSG
ncbi:MAG: SRPBCC family protein [Acidimicrobiia bacterium]